MGGEVGREQLVGRAGERQSGEGVDRDGQEQVEELQRGVEAVAVGVVAEDLAPEQVAHDQEREVLGVVQALVLEREVVPGRQVADRDEDGVEHEGDAGCPKNLATGERSASVTTRCAVPVVERQASSQGG